MKPGYVVVPPYAKFEPARNGRNPEPRRWPWIVALLVAVAVIGVAL